MNPDQVTKDYMCLQRKNKVEKEREIARYKYSSAKNNCKGIDKTDRRTSLSGPVQNRRR